MFKRRALWCCLVLACGSAISSQYSDRKDDELCKAITKTDDEYACQPIDQCPALLRDTTYPKICRFRGRMPVVCCPKSNDRVRPAKAVEKCREYYALTTKGGGTIESDGGCRTAERVEKEHDKNRLTIVGGIAAEESEFPHMVLLGFGEHVKNVEWSCGGSLISDRYVLSAAHCSEIGKK